MKKILTLILLLLSVSMTYAVNFEYEMAKQFYYTENSYEQNFVDAQVIGREIDMPFGTLGRGQDYRWTWIMAYMYVLATKDNNVDRQVKAMYLLNDNWEFGLDKCPYMFDYDNKRNNDMIYKVCKDQYRMMTQKTKFSFELDGRFPIASKYISDLCRYNDNISTCGDLYKRAKVEAKAVCGKTQNKVCSDLNYLFTYNY